MAGKTVREVYDDFNDIERHLLHLALGAIKEMQAGFDNEKWRVADYMIKKSLERA